jgi:hypothetical protein
MPRRRLGLCVLLVSGSSSAVERQLPKLDATGSIPVSRSIILPVGCDRKPPYRRNLQSFDDSLRFIPRLVCSNIHSQLQAIFRKKATDRGAIGALKI